ncbi:MAG TPA: efflux RND transporter periplasmic adaptor subunit [Isosphaeraceae bacterium]|jgi:cobalt-zinc-cadmium efflux system membrane fusion protein|nr:efflux RND transporter periplasmic adaptor subunit [Isosphaeraceae bacterium]
MKWKLPVTLLALAAAGGSAVYYGAMHPTRVLGAWRRLTAPANPPTRDEDDAARTQARGGWDGLLPLPDVQAKAIGLRHEVVEPQTKPTDLRLFGTTDYDPNTLSLVRLQFDSRVDKVHVQLGDAVKKGDPLIDLFSTVLAEAKSTYESNYAQWIRDNAILEKKRPLAETSAIPKNLLEDYKRDEFQSRTNKKVARDRLLIFGLSDKEIEASRNEDGLQKAKMTLRSPAAGFVIKRDVVPGVLYQPSDVLMTIAPLDHFWVWINVNEGDSDKVRVGQDVVVRVPALGNMEFDGKVEYVANQVEPDTRSVKFRVTLLNTEGRLKAGMYARAIVKIRPVSERTVIQRTAMVSVDRDNYVFVRHPGSRGQPDRYERRPVVPFQEGDTLVILAPPTPDGVGLRPGEEVATTGSLILETMYQDKSIDETGTIP